MNPTTILHVITGLDRGGAEAMLLRLCREQRRAGIEVRVLALRSGGSLEPDFAEAKVPLVKLFQLVRGSNTYAPEVIQGWLPHGNLFALFIQKLFFRQARLFWNVRQSLHTWGTSNPMTRGLIKIGAWLSFLPDRIIYNSVVGRKHHESIGYRSDRGVVIGNGFEVEELQSKLAARESVRSRLKVLPDEILLIHVARLDPSKDHATFFAACDQLIKKYPKLKVLCVGKSVDQANLQARGLLPATPSSRLILLGERSDVPELMAASDFYCSSSCAEAFSNAIGEALCLGIPSVVTDVGDSGNIVGASGIIVPPRQANALAEGLCYLMDLDPSALESRRLMAQSRAKELFSLDAISKTYLRLYAESLTGSRRRLIDRDSASP